VLILQIRARDEYVAWADLLKQQLGLRFFVWDISQMGHFGFTKPIPTLYSSEPTTLMKDLAGKTMIILDNEFEYGDYARTVTALSFVIKHEVRVAKKVKLFCSLFYVGDANETCINT